jgi:hypothetical protein
LRGESPTGPELRPQKRGKNPQGPERGTTQPGRKSHRGPPGAALLLDSRAAKRLNSVLEETNGSGGVVGCPNQAHETAKSRATERPSDITVVISSVMSEALSVMPRVMPCYVTMRPWTWSQCFASLPDIRCPTQPMRRLHECWFRLPHRPTTLTRRLPPLLTPCRQSNEARRRLLLRLPLQCHRRLSSQLSPAGRTSFG